jgi:hypothetical protein
MANAWPQAAVAVPTRTCRVRFFQTYVVDYWLAILVHVSERQNRNRQPFTTSVFGA